MPDLRRRLPGAPGVERPNLSVAQVAKVVAWEPLSARVVDANSAAAVVNLGGKPVTDVKTAVMRIG